MQSLGELLHGEVWAAWTVSELYKTKVTSGKAVNLLAQLIRATHHRCCKYQTKRDLDKSKTI